MFAKKTYRGFVAITLAAVAIIIVLCLSPFNPVWHLPIPFEQIQWKPQNIFDFPRNILFFLPFGFGLSGVLAHHSRKDIDSLKIGRRVFVAGMLLSVIMESIQLFIPDRVTSLADVAANSIGALVGYGLFHIWKMGIGRALDRYITRRNLLFGLALYAIGSALLTAYLINRVRLTNWDTSFPLVIGNEATGDRPWQGSVRSLLMDVRCDDPLPPDVSVDYDFSGEAPYENISRRGDEPSLNWSEGPTTPQEDGGVTTGPGEWLITTGPFENFSNYASHCHHIVINTTVTAANLAQSGPARIVSISADTHHRNITLGQEGDALLIRLRTPSSGENGYKPEIIVPDLFAEQQPKDLWVEYNAPMLVVRVNGNAEEYMLSLAPGIAFFTDLQPGNGHWTITMDGWLYRYDIAYGILVVGVALATIAALVAVRRTFGEEARRRRD